MISQFVPQVLKQVVNLSCFSWNKEPVCYQWAMLTPICVTIFINGTWEHYKTSMVALSIDLLLAVPGLWVNGMFLWHLARGGGESENCFFQIFDIFCDALLCKSSWPEIQKYNKLYVFYLHICWRFFYLKISQYKM